MAEVTKTIVPLGLYTDPGPFSAAPDGALVEAQNVVVSREGLLEPRPSIIMRRQLEISTLNLAVEHGHFLDDVGDYVWFYDGASSWTITRDDTDTITGPSDFTPGEINSQYVKGRLLFTSNEGVCEAPQDSGDTIAYRAGLPRPSAPKCSIITSAGSWLATDESTAYRFVLGRERSDGTLMLSAPSCRVIAKNSPAVAGAAYVTFDSSSYGSLTYDPYSVASAFDTLQEGDLLYIYRSNKQTDATLWPNDEMRLRATLTYSSGSFEFFDDKLDDDEWSGPPLYTNSTQEGIAQAHVRPAYARDIALYNGMTFYAGHKSTQRVVLTLKSVEETSAVASPQEILGGNATMTITTVAGSVNISFSSTVLPFLTAGQVLTYGYEPGVGDAVFPANTEIVSINSGALTAVISSAALSGGSWTTRVWDWIQVDDSSGSYRIYGAVYGIFSYLSTADIFLTFRAFGTSTYFVGGYQDLEYRWNNAPTRLPDILLRADGETPYKNILLVFERASLSSDPFTITSTKPLAFDRYVDTVTGVTSAQDGNGSRLSISKTDIPDAYPLLNYIDIGNLSSDIVRVIPAQNTLLVFKEDGIYQVFGNDPSSLSVELLDSTIWPVDTLRSGNWFASLGSNVFMMSSSGPVVVSDISVTPIGAPIMETFREMFGQSFKNLADGDTFYVSAGACPSMPYVMFSYAEQGAQELDPETSLSFVFNTDNGTWTTWTQRRRLSCHWVGQYGRLTAGFGTLDGYAVVGYFDHERDLINQDLTSRTHLLGCDYLENGTMFLDPDSLGGGWYLFTELSSSYHVVNQGDIVVLAFSPYDFGVVEEIVSSSSFKACIYDGLTSGIPNVFYLKEAFPVRVMFAPATFGEPGIEKQILNTLFAFNLRTLLLRFYAEFQTYRLDSNKEQTTEDLALTTGWTQGITAADKTISIEWAPDLMRLDVPRSVASDWATKVGFNIQQACSWFSLGALVLKANVSSDLVNRGRS